MRLTKGIVLVAPFMVSKGRVGLWQEGYELGEAARKVLAPDNCPLKDLPLLMNEAGVHAAASLWQGWASLLVLEALEEGHISVGRWGDKNQPF